MIYPFFLFCLSHSMGEKFCEKFSVSSPKAAPGLGRREAMDIFSGNTKKTRNNIFDTDKNWSRLIQWNFFNWKSRAAWIKQFFIFLIRHTTKTRAKKQSKLEVEVAQVCVGVERISSIYDELQCSHDSATYTSWNSVK